jgi:hypothetical protein
MKNWANELNRAFSKEEVQKYRCWWLTPVILVTQEAEIRRIVVLNNLGQIVCETLSQKKIKQESKMATGTQPQTPNLRDPGTLLRGWRHT